MNLAKLEAIKAAARRLAQQEGTHFRTLPPIDNMTEAHIRTLVITGTVLEKLLPDLRPSVETIGQVASAYWIDSRVLCQMAQASDQADRVAAPAAVTHAIKLLDQHLTAAA